MRYRMPLCAAESMRTFSSPFTVLLLLNPSWHIGRGRTHKGSGSTTRGRSYPRIWNPTRGLRYSSYSHNKTCQTSRQYPLGTTLLSGLYLHR